METTTTATTKEESPAVTFVLFIISIPASLFYVFVAMKIWNMFIPAMFGLPALAFWQAYMLRLVTWAFGPKSEPGPPKTNKQIATNIFGLTISYLVAWGVAVAIV